ncbi:MAG: PQQ-like beta-propeller repeat protein [Acidobacteria bacterium]|nr:PQQ-like beta-propeller repeat protein [Acidobacteriota bacterium]
MPDRVIAVNPAPAPAPPGSPLDSIRSPVTRLLLAILLLQTGVLLATQKKAPTLGGSRNPPAGKPSAGSRPAPPRRSRPRAKVILRVSPPEARVLVNGKLETPDTEGSVEIALGVGQPHLIEVFTGTSQYAGRVFRLVFEKAGDRSLSATLTEQRPEQDQIPEAPLIQLEQELSGDDPLQFEVKLPLMKAPFTIAEAPVGGDVIVDGRKAGVVGPDGTYSGRVLPGEHTVGVESRGYALIPGKYNFSPGGPLRITYGLTVQSQKKGGLEIVKAPVGGKVLLRSHPAEPGKAADPFLHGGEVSPRGRAFVGQLTPGLYDLNVAASDGALWQLEGFMISSNKVTPIEYQGQASEARYESLDQLSAEFERELKGGAESRPVETGVSVSPPAVTERPATDALIPPPEPAKPAPAPLTIEGNLTAAVVTIDDQLQYAIPELVGDVLETKAEWQGREVAIKLERGAAGVKLEFDDVQAGSHRLVVRRSGYRESAQEFTAVAGRVSELAVKLDPLPWEATVFRWRDNPASKPIRSSPALSADGKRVYIGDDGGNLLAYELPEAAAAGTENPAKFRFKAADAISAAPLVALDGTIIVCARNGIIHGLVDRGNGFEERWPANADARGTTIDAGPALTPDGQAVVIGTSAGAVALALSTGGVIWRRAVEGAILGGPVIAMSDGTIYVLTDIGNLYALRPDGTLKWPRPFSVTAGFGLLAPALDQKGTLYVGALDGYLRAIRDTGTEAEMDWMSSSRVGDRIECSPIVGRDGTVYVGTRGPAITPISSNGAVGSPYRQGVMGTAAVAALTLASDQTVYAASSGSSLLAFRGDGSFKGALPTQGPVESSPLVTPEGWIVFGTLEGVVYGLKEANGGLDRSAPWPTAGHDEYHRGRR